MKYSIDDIKILLQEYKDLVNKAAQLRFELANIVDFSDEELIDSMTFLGKLDIDIPITTVTNDKTARIAISYVKRKDEMQTKLIKEISNELISIYSEINRIEYYIQLLEEKQKNLLIKIYLEGMNISKAAECLKISLPTARKIHSAGIEKLTLMYNNLIESTSQ